MKRLLLPENKISRLFINILFIVIWLPSGLYLHVWLSDLIEYLNYSFYWDIYSNIRIYLFFSALFAPIVFGTRYIWFKKTRDKIFNGFFDKFNFNVDLKKLEPRIYTTTSNADELKKYADLRDQGIITEEEFQAKKKKLLDL